MAELFVVGSFAFWALIAVEIILLYVFEANENGVGSVLSLLGFAALLQWFGGVDILGTIHAKPWYVPMFLIALVLPGIAWMIWRWRKYVKMRIREYQDKRTEFMEGHGFDPNGEMDGPTKLAWMNELVRSTPYKSWFGKPLTLADSPKVRHHKSMCVGWMMFWPVSMSWYFLHDFLKELWLDIYHWFAGFLQRIADDLYAKVDTQKDLPSESESRTNSRQGRRE